MLELFVDKSHFFKFLSMSNKPQLHQLKIISSSLRMAEIVVAVDIL